MLDIDVSVRSWQLRGLQLRLSVTSDIVLEPPRGCRVLLNPANEALVGTKLPYFPMLEPPTELLSNQWCGMEAGERMFYPMQVVDGRVHMLGGLSLRKALEKLPEVAPDVRCPTGAAVITEATESLGDVFQHIVHAVPWGTQGLP